MVQDSSCINQNIAMRVKCLPFVQVLNGDIVPAKLLIPVRPGDFMLSFDVLMKMILSRKSIKVLKYISATCVDC